MSEFLELEAKCPCGRVGRYFHIDNNGNQVMSCNKHSVCLTYEELEKVIIKHKKLYRELLNAAGDVISFREGTDYYEESARVIRKHQEGVYGQFN